MRCAAVLAFASVATAKLPGPSVQPTDFEPQWYGDADDVALLAGLLGDADVRVRERAVGDLGQTRNAAALPHIRTALKDAASAVRCAAIQAAAELAVEGSTDVVHQGLRSGDGEMILSAIRASNSHKLEPGELAGPLLEHADRQIRSEMLACLTRLGRSAPSAALAKLLSDAQPLVRLRAAENAFYGDDRTLIEPLLNSARTEGPATASLALAALGKLAKEKLADLPAVREAIDQAAIHQHPLMRAGAVRALEGLGQGARIRPFLDDASPLVRHPAVQAAGRLKCADCAERVFHLMIDAPLDDYLQTYRSVPLADPYYAAREALKSIATERVAELAEQKLTELADEIKRVEAIYVDGAFGPRKSAAQLTPPFVRRQHRLQRDVSACAELLGSLRSQRGFQTQLDLLVNLPVDSIAVLHIARSLGRIGDRRAVGPLIKTVGVCTINGVKFLQAAAAQQPPPLPYKDQVSAAVVDALGELNDPQAAESVRNMGAVNVMGGRLSDPAAAAARVLPQWVNDANRAGIESFLLTALGGNGYAMGAQHDAARAAVQLKMDKAVDPLRRILKDRYNDTMARVSAWAIQELTGQAPVIPPPRPRPGDWIIRKGGR